MAGKGSVAFDSCSHSTGILGNHLLLQMKVHPEGRRPSAGGALFQGAPPSFILLRKILRVKDLLQAKRTAREEFEWVTSLSSG